MLAIQELQRAFLYGNFMATIFYVRRLRNILSLVHMHFQARTRQLKRDSSFSSMKLCEMVEYQKLSPNAFMNYERCVIHTLTQE